MSGAEKNLRRMLECLQYPNHAEVALDNTEEILQLIVWLEDRKVRALEVSEREPLRHIHPAWDEAVSKVVCPLIDLWYPSL